MLASKELVANLIPQGPPMIMVDRLLYHDEQKSLSCFRIEHDNLFVNKGLLSETGLIENMAQTAALRTGWLALQQSQGSKNIKPPIGVIGAIKNFKLYRLPSASKEIQTEVIVQAEIMNATMIIGKVMNGTEILAECEMKIFLQE
jgi:predicted hotdog family 3-hydroxylacyl-ACP dehydratase